MKSFVYIIICLTIISIGSLFILKSPKGEPWLSVSDFYNHQAFSQKVTTFKNTLMDKAELLLNSKEDPEIYKWQDDKGVWHYSDKKSGNGKVWEKPENLTVIPAIEPINKSGSEKLMTKKDTSQPTIASKTPNKVKELINDTHNVQSLMDNRTNQIDKQLESIND